MKVLSAPTNVFWNVTNGCNLRCRHCSADAAGAALDEMSAGEARAVADHLIRSGVFTVVLTGGEPLLREDFFALVERLRKNHRQVSVNTNATLVRKAEAEALRKQGVTAVNVGLDGATAVDNARLRGEASFEAQIAGLASLTAAGLKVGLGYTVTRHNCDSLEGIVRLGRQLGVTGVAFQRLYPMGRASGRNGPFLPTAAQDALVTAQLQKLIEQYPGFLAGPYVNKARTAGRPEPTVAAAPKKIARCGIGVQSCVINPDGGVAACNVARDLTCGNIRERSLKEIWRDGATFLELRSIREMGVDRLAGCQGCNYVGACAGGCRAAAWLASGSWLGSDDFDCRRYRSVPSGGEQ